MNFVSTKIIIIMQNIVMLMKIIKVPR